MRLKWKYGIPCHSPIYFVLHIHGWFENLIWRSAPNLSIYDYFRILSWPGRDIYLKFQLYRKTMLRLNLISLIVKSEESEHHMLIRDQRLETDIHPPGLLPVYLVMMKTKTNDQPDWNPNPMTEFARPSNAPNSLAKRTRIGSYGTKGSIVTCQSGN